MRIKPQLAKAGELPTGPGWLYEVKHDGYRGIAVIEDGKVTLQSRSGKRDLTVDFPEVVEALREAPCDCVLDGEIVVLGADGNSNFERMPERESAQFIVFDCLEREDDLRERSTVDLRYLPLTDRREEATKIVEWIGSPRVTMSVATEDGRILLDLAILQGIEGIVAKRTNSKYREGSRNGDWIKVKLRCEQEFAVLGWIPGEGNRAGIAGSLLLAVHDGKNFHYCGRVGTGGDLKQWADFARPTKYDEQPLNTWMNGAPRAELRDVVWIEPFVVQVKFQRWTEDNHLWHPSVVGVRVDKEPNECRREA